MTDDLIGRLSADPANVARQLRALASISDESRAMHRFDQYLEAAANVIEQDATRIRELEARVEEATNALEDPSLDYEARIKRAKLALLAKDQPHAD